MASFPRLAPIVLVALLGVVPPALRVATAQDVRLGGGSDIPAGSVLPLPPGATVPPLHHVFADNPESRPIEVEFRADAPTGIEVTPEQPRLRIPPGESAKDPFSITVVETMPPGDHEITVQLVRSDVRARPGELTNIPAVGTTFTVRVTGEAATVEVTAVSVQTGAPVEGTLTLAAVTGTGPALEVARAVGSELRATVAPGTYEAAYVFEGRRLASEQLMVAADETASVVLNVETVSFVLVTARPVKEDGKVVVADLVASVENHLRPIEGDVTIRAVVHRDGEVMETVALDERDGLPLGVTEAKLPYRPADGFPGGTYRFTFELVTDEFNLRAGDEPGFEVGGPRSLLATAGIGVGAAAGVAAVWILVRRMRRGVVPGRRPSAGRARGRPRDGHRRRGA